MHPHTHTHTETYCMYFFVYFSVWICSERQMRTKTNHGADRVWFMDVTQHQKHTRLWHACYEKPKEKQLRLNTKIDIGIFLWDLQQKLANFFVAAEMAELLWKPVIYLNLALQYLEKCTSVTLMGQSFTLVLKNTSMKRNALLPGEHMPTYRKNSCGTREEM